MSMFLTLRDPIVKVLAGFLSIAGTLTAASAAVYPKPASETPIAFPLSNHKKIRDRSLSRAVADLDLKVSSKTLKSWRKRLNRSNLYQDIFRFFWARYHFDNCNFRQGIEQVRRFQLEIERDYERLAISTSRSARDKYRGRIMFKTGRIIHALQDFYSHSNYVELSSARFDSIDEVPLVDMWSRDGQDQFLDLINDGLESHYFLLSFPKRCSKRPMPHLSKDPGRSRAGRVPTRWKRPGGDNYTAFEAAYFLSEVATTHIFKELFKKYPLLVENEN